MMRWVITGTIDPTKLEGVVSGRDGGNIMFVAYSRALRKWFWVIPGETEREIPEPQMILVDESYVSRNRRLSSTLPQKSRSIRKSREPEQLQLL